VKFVDGGYGAQGLGPEYGRSGRARKKPDEIDAGGSRKVLWMKMMAQGGRARLPRGPGLVMMIIRGMAQ
jgi:hypothetical protein